jgi:hypothetical protein
MKTVTTILLSLVVNIIFSQELWNLTYNETQDELEILNNDPLFKVTPAAYDERFLFEKKMSSNLNVDTFSVVFVQHLNKYRKSLGLNPVSVDYRLKDLSVDHSTYMSKTGVLSHGQLGVKGKENLGERARTMLTFNCLISECCTMGHKVVPFTYFYKPSNKYSKYDFVAEYYLMMFKLSKPHNELMTDPKVINAYCSIVFGEKFHGVTLDLSKN